MSITKTVFAPAKVNLCLHVLGRRPDGYHDLAMIMQRVDLFDQIDLKLVQGTDVTVSCPGLVLAEGEQNIVEKAVRLLLRYVNLEQGVSVAVNKSIPSAAGLGGGSSDAASVLEALDEMLELKLSTTELMGLGSCLGADVPFFLYKKTAWATGIGDRFEPWPAMPPVALILVNPGVEVSTAGVFKTLGLTCPRPIARIPRFPVGTSDLACLLRNDLEVVTCQHHPVITAIKERLVSAGAAGALMSGSGPTVFGLFDDLSQAENVARNLSVETDWWVQVVNPL
jgi:4-diphosphocytidyl-2-C-methyl-D-erythritol kinase